MLTAGKNRGRGEGKASRGRGDPICHTARPKNPKIPKFDFHSKPARGNLGAW